MAREYAKTNLAIWQDPAWRSLPWPAQHVYKMFWEHPGLSYCGVVDWRPAKMLGYGAGWDRPTLDALTDCLRARHFLVVDEDTEECLVRSWVRFDGVIRQPRLAVSMSNAYGEVGSNTLRGVMVNELCKLRDREPAAQGWAKQQIVDMLALPQVEAKALPVPADPFGAGFAITLGTVSGSVSPSFGPNVVPGLGSVSTPPTTAPATSSSPLHPGAAAEDSEDGSDSSPPATEPKSRRATQLPQSFRPSEAHSVMASGLGVDLTQEWPRFCDHHIAKGSTFKDWDAALRTWIRNAEKFAAASGMKAGPRSRIPTVQEIDAAGDPPSDPVAYKAWYAKLHGAQP